MKTTIELPESLVAEATAEAARRRITLREMFENALRREIGDSGEFPPSDAPFELNQYGYPVLKRRGGSRVSSEEIYELIENEGIQG